MHSKYNGIFGNLLMCLNMYIAFNDGWLREEPYAIQSIHNMSLKSLLYNEKKNLNVTTN